MKKDNLNRVSSFGSYDFQANGQRLLKKIGFGKLVVQIDCIGYVSRKRTTTQHISNFGSA